MKKFQHSQKEQLSKNIFVFIREKKQILFNRLNFYRKYIENKTSFFQLKKEAQKMEQKSPEMKFFNPSLKKIRVEVTLRCNCKCDYCLVFQNNLPQINSSMSENTAQKIINFYQRNIQNGSIMISGGEPLLNWPVVKLFIKKIKDSIKIFTNGTIINQDILGTLRKNQNVKLMISLDGKRIHNKKRKFQNGKEIYSMVIKNIKIFQKNNCNLGIACLCTNENVKDLYKITKFFVNNLGIKYLGISFPHYISNSFNQKNDLDIKKYTDEMINIFDFAVKNKVYIDQLAKRFSPLITKSFQFYSCKLVGEQKTFYPDGKTTFCAKIDSLNNSKKYNLRYFKNAIPINNQFCQNCPAIGICGGGCFWDGIMRFKNEIDERECILNNSLLDFFLWKIYFTEKAKILLRKKFSSLIIK